MAVLFDDTHVRTHTKLRRRQRLPESLKKDGIPETTVWCNGEEEK